MTTQLTLFDYAALDTETRIVIQQRTTEIKALMKRAASDIIEIGQKLIEVKARLGHGHFDGWVKAEFDWTRQTAYRFINVAERFGDCNNLLQMAPSALYLLAAPSTPEAARIEAIARAESGESITHQAARTIVAEHKNGNGYIPTHEQWTKDNAEIGLDEFNEPLLPYEQQIANQYFVDDEEEETDLRYDPTQHMAYCKYCYTTHNDWVCEEDKAWECQRCTHRTRDDFMQIVEEPEPETIDYGLDSNEWYTPIEFINAARSVMGSIDIDPASNDTAQEQIQAGDYFTKERDGLAQEWGGNIWLNPPYGDLLPWVEKLLAEFEAGRTQQAILLVNTANSPQWSRLLWHSMFTVCLLDRRVRFWRPDRAEAKGTAQDQMIWYVGYETDKFRREFEAYGAIR